MANTRRPQGDGTIRKREDGRWEGRIIIGHKNNGTPIYKSVFGKTQKSTLKALHQLIDLYRDVDLTEECRMTLGEWMDKWLNEYMLFTVRENTILAYRRYIECQIKPYLGAKQLVRLTTTDIQKFYNNVKKEGRKSEHPLLGRTLSAAMVRKIHMVLHQALDVAVKERLIVRNPTNGTTLPKKECTEKQILDDAQLNKFLSVVQSTPYWCDFFYVELLTGLRRGEICGLKWSDLNLSAGTVTIRRSVQKKGSSVSIGETKTEAGTRVLLLPPSVAELLKTKQKDAISEWVFPHYNNPADPIHPDTAYKALKTLLRHAELPSIRFHDLRHTFATHAMQSGVDAKTLASLLGHTNAAFTLDTYTHVTTDMQRNASVVVNNMMQQFLQTGGTDG